MSDAPDAGYGAAQLQRELTTVWPGLRVEVAARVDSTNTRLVEALRTGGADPEPRLLVGVEQTAGRGRQGRIWHSRAGASLTFSLAVPLDPPAWSGLSLAVGVALAEALDPGGCRIGLKWPNDLLRIDSPGRGRKLGGVLVETVAVGARRFAVVGIGLNVLPIDDLPEFASGFASLSELGTGIAGAPDALQRVALPLALALQRFGAQGFAPFATAFDARDLLRGQRVTTADAVEGIAAGVGEDGALRLRRGEDIVTVVSGEVGLAPESA